MTAAKVCNIPGCPNLTKSGRCDQHRRQADQARGPRGYNTAGHRTFRAAVLTRDPQCVLCRQAPSTIADHYPISRRDLITGGLNPNDPTRGRGLCKPCHDRETAKHQPGGFHTRHAT